MAAIIPIAFQLAAAYLIPAGTGIAVSSLIMGGAALLGGYVANELFGKDAASQNTDVRGNYVSAERTVPVVYGTRIMGSNDVFVASGTKGEKDDNGGSYFFIDHVLCEGEIEGINRIDIDGVMWDEIYIGGVPLWELEPSKLKRITYWFYAGTNTQDVNEQIKRGTRKDSQDKYTDPLRNVAHVVFRLERSKKGYTSIPSREVVIKGQLCFDPRSSVTKWTNNPALHLYDYVTNPRYGLNWSDSLLYLPSFNETATYCETGTLHLSFGILSTGVTTDIFILTQADDYNAIKDGFYISVDYEIFKVIRKLGDLSILVDSASSARVDKPFEFMSPKWSFNYVIASPIKSQTIIDTMLGHFRGAVYWGNALLYLRYLDLREETPEFTIEDHHIARDQSGTALVGVSQPSRFNIPEGAVVSFINAHDNWVTDRITIGERLGQIKAIDFVGFTDRNLAHEMGLYVLERQRLNRTFTLVLRPDTVALDTNDLIAITASELELNNQFARVKSNDISGAGLITVTAILESETLYDSVFNPDTSKIYDVDLPSTGAAPPSVEGVYVVEETYFNRGRSFVRLKVYFSPPSDYPWFSNVDVYVGFPNVLTESVGTLSTGITNDIFVLSDIEDYNDIYVGYSIKFGVDSFEVIQKLDSLSLLVEPLGIARSDDSFTYEAPSYDPNEDVYLYRFPASDSFALEPVDEGQTYYIRLNSVSSYGIAQDHADAAHVVHYVRGVSDIYPTCPTYLDVAVNLTSVDIISNVIADPDIEGYEIRLGSTWSSAIFIIFRGSPSVSFSGVKPGLHRFWLDTKHKNGLYCPFRLPDYTGPISKEALVEDPPPGSKLFFTHEVDYLDGTPTDMVVTSDTLTVDHDDANLVGELVTDIIDTGNEDANEKMLVYVLFDFSLTGGDNTWKNLAPTYPDVPLVDAFDWFDFAFDYVENAWRTWYMLLGDYDRLAASKVEVGLDFSSDPTMTTYKTVERLELLSTIVTGQYVRIRYKITDVNNISYIVIGKSTLKASYLEETLVIDA